MPLKLYNATFLTYLKKQFVKVKCIVQVVQWKSDKDLMFDKMGLSSNKKMINVTQKKTIKVTHITLNNAKN